MGSGTTVLFLPSPSTSGSWGSTVRLATIAEECRKRGDRVVFHAPTPSDQQLRQRGMEVIPFSGIAASGLSSGPVDTFYDICEVLGLGEAESWERLLNAEADAISDVEPDVIVADMRPSAPISAARHGIPLAACAWVGADPRLHATGDHPYDDLARSIAAKWSAPEPESLAELMYWRSDRQLALSFPAFEPELTDAPAVTYTGYLKDTWRLPGAPLIAPERLIVVYASSSPWGVPSTVDALDEAARRADVTVWCVLRSDSRAQRYSDRCHVFQYLPMDEVLPSCSAMIFHGGLSTSVASLHYGVPTLAVPGKHYERRRNADRLVAIGSGLTGELIDLLPSRLSTLLEQLVEDPRIRAAAQAARAEAADYHGAVAAADAVHSLCGRGA